MTQISTAKTALFPGSFRPFTVGHADIVRRALDVFDRIIIGVGVNIAKDPTGAQCVVENIEIIYSNEPRVSVRTYSSLTARFAAEVGACAIVRGIRSVKDFEYERDMADVNARLEPAIPTVVLFADPSLAAISSSVVRELQAFGENVDQYLP